MTKYQVIIGGTGPDQRGGRVFTPETDTIAQAINKAWEWYTAEAVSALANQPISARRLP